MRRDGATPVVLSGEREKAGLGKRQEEEGHRWRAESAGSVILRYARRTHVEDGVGQAVNFFHLDCLGRQLSA
jgi:hypothetical protein